MSVLEQMLMLFVYVMSYESCVLPHDQSELIFSPRDLDDLIKARVVPTRQDLVS